MTRLGRLALVCPQEDNSAESYAAKFSVYLEALVDYPPEVIAQACDRYMKNPTSKFFPTVGDLCGLCSAIVNAERTSHGSKAYFRAPPEMRAEYERTAVELKKWLQTRPDLAAKNAEA